MREGYKTRRKGMHETLFLRPIDEPATLPAGKITIGAIAKSREKASKKQWAGERFWEFSPIRPIGGLTWPKPSQQFRIPAGAFDGACDTLDPFEMRVYDIPFYGHDN